MISQGPSVLRLARFVNGNPYKPDALGDVGFPVIRIRQLVDESAPWEFAEPPPHPVFIDDGDIVFSWSATLAVRVWGRGKALLNQHLFRVDVRPDIDPRWFAYVLMTGIDRLQPLMHGSAMTHITLDMLRSLTIAVPPLADQRAIANFLDAETARIDALIEKKRRMVALLEERRMSAMTEGVSGQMTEDATRPSTLPWISECGATWKEARLTLVARQGTGHTPSREHPEWWVDCNIPWITTGEVAQVRSDRVEVIDETREKISLLGTANSSAEVHPAGTVVLCRTASAGYSAIMGSDMATSQDFATWTCGPLLRPRFLLLCLRAMRQDLLGRLAMGSTHKTIYMPDIGALRIPLPDTDTQDRIIDVVEKALGYVNAMTDVLARQIDLLVERRQALITAAVTGELTIPGAAA